MNIQERLTAFAMLGAGWVMWLLVLLSVIILAIILERAWYLFKTRTDAVALQAALRDKLAAADFEGASKMLEASPSFEASIARAGLADAHSGPDAVEERIQGAKIIAKARMERNLAFIGTIGNNAPFVGCWEPSSGSFGRSRRSTTARARSRPGSWPKSVKRWSPRRSVSSSPSRPSPPTTTSSASSRPGWCGPRRSATTSSPPQGSRRRRGRLMAGGSMGGDDDDLITDINVTPLVDVVLVLLIILMVTATAIVSNTLPVELPDASTAESAPSTRGPWA